MSETKKETSEMKLTDLDKYYKEIFIVTNGISTWIEAYNDENGVILSYTDNELAETSLTIHRMVEKSES